MVVDSGRRNSAGVATWLLATTLMAALVYLASLPWRAERAVDRFDSGMAGPGPVSPPALAESPWRAVARAARRQSPPDLAAAEAALRRAAALRPLFAPTWLQLADVVLESGDRAAALEYAARAEALWPANPDLQRAAVDFHLKAGDREAALRTLGRYWRLVPHRWLEVLALAGRLERDPGRLYPAVVPGEAPAGVDPHYFAARFQDFARRTRDPALAIAGWQQATPGFRADSAEALRYIDFLLAQRRLAPARQAWAELTGAESAPGQVHNPGFESDLLRGGFGWRLYPAEGVSASVDEGLAHGGSRSMRLAFDGAANLNYHHLRQTVEVEPGATYRLQATWRGDRITTRSGVFLDIRTIDSDRNVYVRTSARHGSWDWQPVTAEISIPADATLAEIRLRRDPTDALDSRIAGDLWLDDVTLAAE